MDCTWNQLTSLDLSANTVLSNVNCDNNGLISLDLSANTVLTQLGCFSNQLASLDLSANTVLYKLNCENNELTSLNIRNGNNTNMSTGDFRVNNNSNLTCIKVDDASYSTNNWTNIDVGAYFSTNCPSAIEDFDIFNFEYYPNPVNNTLSVKANESITELIIYDILGQELMHISPNNNEQYIDMSSFNSSTYFMKVIINNTTKTFKILKQ